VSAVYMNVHCSNSSPVLVSAVYMNVQCSNSSPFFSVCCLYECIMFKL